MNASVHTPMMSRLARQSRRGMALVLTLCFLVLISAMVMSFLSQTFFDHQIAAGAVAQSNSDMLARAAADIVVGELQGEISNTNSSLIYSADGSDVTSNPALGTAPYIFEPKTVAKMIPEKRGSPDSSWSSMLKRSYASTASESSLYTGGRNLVSIGASAATSARSVNGRKIDDTTWRKSAAVASGTATIDNNWCILTRKGPASFSDSDISKLRDSKSDDYAIGRFSYVIYDTGGMLDINAAGYPSTLAADDIQKLKGSLAGSDLVQFGFTSGQLANLITFRNAGSASTFSTSSERLAKLAYLQSLKGDNAFLGRQDLIKYCTDNGLTDKLPYLTHFSRELAAPNWGPTKNAADMGGSNTSGGGGPSYAYKNNRNSSSAVNRFLPNVRFRHAGTIQPYKDDGTKTGASYTVAVGDPLVQRRFSLARLQWLGRNGPANGGTAENIQSCFGLSWDGTNRRWNYVGPSGSSVQTTIATLDSIANETTPREPNFFELLQAGILQGSLGRIPSGTLLVREGTNLATAAEVDRSAMHVVQIAANVIDQQDTDSFPTRIYFNGTEVYGTENIPYISKFILGAYRPLGTTAGVSRGLIKSWVEFELWNPYQGPATDQASSFRIRMDGSGTARISLKTDQSSSTESTPGASGKTITVVSSSLSTLAQDPKLLDTLRQAGASVSSDDADAIYANADGSGANYTGFFAGNILLNAGENPTTVRFSFALPKFVLELNDQGTYVPVQQLAISSVMTTYAGSAGGDLLVANRRFNGFGCTDPRTMRFGVGYLYELGKYDKTMVWSYSDTTRQASIPNGTGFLPTYTYDGSAYNIFRHADNQGDGTRSAPTYTDVDSVQRRGDALWSTSTPVNPMSPFSTGLKQRPVLLNRQFRTVAEMGYAFRDQPFKSIDFFSAKSGDSALLDLFSVRESLPVRAGVIGLNSQYGSSKKAVLIGTYKNPQGDQITSSDADLAVSAYNTYVTATPIISTADQAFIIPVTSLDPLSYIKGERESLLRGMGQAGQSRTWNFMIDIIAQAGRFPPTADALSKFVVDGEKRYWVHVAIDRFTGKIVSQQLESVSD